MSIQAEKAIPIRHDLTYDDYLTLPDDGMRYEIIEGDLFMTPARVPKHQKISGRIFRRLEEFIRKNDLGDVFYAPCDVVFSPRDVVQPDILYISRQRSHLITEKNIQGAPDLIVEITSPNTEAVDKGRKKALYQRWGVKEYWIVDMIKEEIEVWNLQAGVYQLHGHYTRNDVVKSSLLKGLKVSVTEIFEE